MGIFEDAKSLHFLHTPAPPFISCLPIRMVKMRTRHSLASFFLLGGVSRHKNTAPWCFCLLTSRRGANRTEAFGTSNMRRAEREKEYIFIN